MFTTLGQYVEVGDLLTFPVNCPRKTRKGERVEARVTRIAGDYAYDADGNYRDVGVDEIVTILEG